MRTAIRFGAIIQGPFLFLLSLLAFGAPARADVTVSPAAINFGTVAVGLTSAPVSVTLTNTGSRRAKFSGVSITGTVFAYSGPTGSFTVQGHSRITVSVSFRPNAAQAFSGSLTFNRSFGASTVVPLSGTGQAAATPLTTQAPSITSQPVSRTVTAGQTASFSVSVSGTSPFAYQWTKNGSAISGATSSSYTTPATTTSDNGAQFAVTVANSAGSVTSNAATLTVNAATLLLTVNPVSLSFGNVNLGSSASKQATLTNSGTGNVTISGLALSGAGFTAAGVSSGQVLAPGQTAAVAVTFQPSSAGSVSGSVTVSSDAAPAVVSLSGSGVQLVTHSVALSWAQSTSTVLGYYVYSSQVTGGPYSRISGSIVNVPGYTDSSVQSGKTYYYVVTAVDSSGMESPYSNQAVAAIP
jgi:hypothetical protein